MDWQTEPHTVDPVIAVAVEHVERLLHPLEAVAKEFGIDLDEPTPIINARDCELAGFNLADVMAAYRMEAR